jgi:serine/threonine protein kinase
LEGTNPSNQTANNSQDNATETSNGVSNETEEIDNDDDIPEDPVINRNSVPSLVRRTMYQMITFPQKISSGKIYDQYRLNVSNKFFSGEMIYLFTFKPFKEDSEDAVLSRGVQENLYHIVNINNHLMEMDEKDLYFRRFNFCYEISRAIILQKQSMNIFNKLEVDDQPTKLILMSYEDNNLRLDQLLHQIMNNQVSLLFTEFLKMYKNMALGVKLLHKKFFHCNINLESYSVQSLDDQHKEFFQAEFFEPVILSDKRAITLKLERFGDLTSKFDKCKDGELGNRPHEMFYKSLSTSFKHDVYSLAVTILDIEYMYTLKQRPSELLAILMKYFDGPGTELKKRFMNPGEQLTDEEFDEEILKKFQGELSKNLLFNFLIEQVKNPHNLVMRQNVLKFLKEEKEITEEEFKMAFEGVAEMEDLCLKKSIRLISLTVRELLMQVLESTVSAMRMNKKSMEIKSMEKLFYIERRIDKPIEINEDQKKALVESLLKVKAIDYQRDTMNSFYKLIREAFHYKWAKRVPIIHFVNEIIKIQIELENKLKPAREMAESFNVHDFMSLDLEDPAEGLD